MLLDLSIMLLETFILQVSLVMIIIYVHLVLIVHATGGQHYNLYLNVVHFFNTSVH